MKILDFKRNPSEIPDSYLSSMQVLDDRGGELVTSNRINTLHSADMPGGKLAPVICYGIYHPEFGYPGFVFFRSDVDYKTITDWTQLTEEQRTFESLIPNPTQNNEMIMKLINFHIGVNAHNAGSNGCQSYDPSEVDKFTGIFKDNEIVIVKLA